MNEEKKPEETYKGRSLPEWITFGISAAIVSGIVGLVGYDWVATRHEPPLISVEINGEIRAAGGQFYVPFKVTNAGGSTAESVQAIAELSIGGKVEESGEQQIDFLSGGETEKGEFVFTRNPRDGELKMRVASYKLP